MANYYIVTLFGPRHNIFYVAASQPVLVNGHLSFVDADGLRAVQTDLHYCWGQARVLESLARLMEQVKQMNEEARRAACPANNRGGA